MFLGGAPPVHPIVTLRFISGEPLLFWWDFGGVLPTAPHQSALPLCACLGMQVCVHLAAATKPQTTIALPTVQRKGKRVAANKMQSL